MSKPVLHCQKCGYAWVPLKERAPKGCARCNTTYWNKDGDIPKRKRRTPLVCQVCGYKWYPDKDTAPKVCANRECQSKFWNGSEARIYNGWGPNPVPIINGYKQCSDKEHVGPNPLPITEFTPAKESGNGYRPHCHACDNRRRRKARIKDPEKFAQAHRIYNEAHRERNWAWHVRQHHKRRGFIVEISLDELEQLAKSTSHCAICGIKLCWTHHSVLPDTPTADRINNGKVLRKDNVMIVCHQCNRTKGERTMDEFINYCKNVIAELGGG